MSIFYFSSILHTILHIISHVYFRYTEDIKTIFIFLKIKLCNNSIFVLDISI